MPMTFWGPFIQGQTPSYFPSAGADGPRGTRDGTPPCALAARRATGGGKSRLVQELKERINQEDAPRIEFRCSPYHQNSALYPIIEHLQRLLQFQREDTSQA